MEQWTTFEPDVERHKIVVHSFPLPSRQGVGARQTSCGVLEPPLALCIWQPVSALYTSFLSLVRTELPMRQSLRMPKLPLEFVRNHLSVQSVCGRRGARRRVASLRASRLRLLTGTTGERQPRTLHGPSPSATSQALIDPSLQEPIATEEQKQWGQPCAPPEYKRALRPPGRRGHK